MVEDLRTELLTQELPMLIRRAIDTSDISEIIKNRLTKEQRHTLENEAFSEAQNFLNFSQREVNDLARARTSLFEHEGRSPTARASRARVTHTVKSTGGTLGDESSGTPTAAADASPHDSVLSRTFGDKDGPRFALAMLALANLTVFGTIFGIWAGWARTVDLSWPWKLLIAACCYAAAISVAAILVIGADQRMAMTAPGLPIRSLNGGTPRVVGGLFLGSSAISAVIAFIGTLGREWTPSTHTATLIGAFILWSVSAIILIIVCIVAMMFAVAILRPLAAGSALMASATAVLYLIAFLLFWVSSAHGIGLTWAIILWGAGGIATLTIGIVTASSYRANNRTVETAESVDTDFDTGPTRSSSSADFRSAGPMETRHQLMSTIPIGQWRQQRKKLELAVIQAMSRWQETVTERAILPYLRLRINSILEPRFDRKFSIFDASGLHQARARQHLVKTDALQQFRRVHRMLDGGAVALVGPRGAGKTTILEALTEDEWIGGAVGRLLIIENAPLEYQPREFALHLYARLCQQVIQLDASRRTKVHPGLHKQVRRYGMLAAFLLAMFTLGSIVDGFRSSRVVSVLDLWLLLIAAVSIASLAVFVILGRFRGKPAPFDTTDQKPVSLAVLCEQAEQQLIQIRYLQRHTLGWSGTLSAGGAQAGGSRSVEFAQQTMTHPEVVHAFRNFLQKTVEVLTDRFGNLPAPVIIAIDELDRLPAGASASFVSEIKALFSPPLPGCLNLMAVSDQETFGDGSEGAASLEALHSAFDAIIPVRHLPLSGAMELLRSRAIGLPDPFLWLCHCLSGGLPRELIRIARTVVDLGIGLEDDMKEGQEDDLTWISRKIIGAELTTNATIMRSAARLFSERLRVPVSEILRSTRPRPPDSAELLDLVGAVTTVSIESELESGLTQGFGRQNSWLTAFGQLYQYATVLETFEAGAAIGYREHTLRDAYEDHGVLETFDTLATSKPLLSVEPWLGWQLVTSFREKWNMKVYNLPA